MKNFINDGTSMKFTAPSGGVIGGQGYIIGDALVIAAFTIAEGGECTGHLRGCYELTALTGDVATEGELAYWDDAAKVVTLTVGALKVSGYFGKDKLNGEVLCHFILNGTALV